MKSRLTSTLAIVIFVVAVCMRTSGTALADGLIANWTLNDGGAAGNTIGAGAPIADSGPNGYNGSVVASSGVVTSVPGIIGTGLSFNSTGNTSATGAYIQTPATANGTSLGGMDSLTVSYWLNIPSLPTAQANLENALDLWDGGTSPVECWEVGTSYRTLLTTSNGLSYGFNGTTENDHGDQDSSGNKGFWTRTNGTGFQANTWEQVTIEYYGGNSSTATGFLQLYVNGLFVGPSEIGGPIPPDHPIPIPSPSSGQIMEIGGGSAYGTTTTFGGALNDIGVWQTNLSGVMTFANEINQYGQGVNEAFPPEGTAAGGEVGALYNTPMFNNHSGALSQYGVSAMDKLFTIYDSQSATPIGVTTSNGTLGWKYVAGGLLGTSGYAGQMGDGQYYIQLDANSGGVESFLPGDANCDGRVDINDLTIVLANYNQTGKGWADGEFTGDGTVDINDLTIVLANYNKSYSASAGGLAAVPEPSAIMLLSLALAGIFAYASRRRS
jgi:hypothetical protein